MPPPSPVLPPRRAVFILGMHRSGTSLVAALLRMAGVELGTDLLLGNAQENRRGFWEQREVLRLDEELLARLGLSWFVPTPLPERWWEHPRVEPLKERAAELLRQEFGNARLWGVKEPRLCRLQRFWEEAAAGLADRIHAIHVFRHPLEVADSLYARNRIPAEQALLLWLLYNLDAVLQHRGGHLTSLSMNQTLADPVATVARLRTALGESGDLEAGLTQEILAFVEPKLRHHHADPTDPRLATPAGKLAQECHRQLERLAEGEDALPELTALQDRLGALLDQRRQTLEARKERTVDVIVPVHRGLEVTLRCIDTVLAAGGPLHLVVINDASPEPDLTEQLRQRAATGAFQLLENPQNLGFVASVNRGMQLHPERDTVLLNSDALVPLGWLERLHTAAYTDPWIGTVTPFSNNATLCSYPLPQADNPLPQGWELEGLDTLFRNANRGWILDIPTAVGFCMYIRRDCLDAIGYFDEANFGRGYGEETDFSMRAQKGGWRNVLAADLFVYHEGSVSFGAEASPRRGQAALRMRDLHPEYAPTVERFLRDDPLAIAREPVDYARVIAGGVAELQAVLHERSDLLARRRRLLDEESEYLRRELTDLDQALGHAQHIVEEQTERIGQLDQALDHAQHIVEEQTERIGQLEAGLAEAQSLVAIKEAEARTLSEAFRKAETLAVERTEANRKLDAALAEAVRLAEQNGREARELTAALAIAERLAHERMEEAQELDQALRVRDEALSQAQQVVAEKSAELAASAERERDLRTALREAHLIIAWVEQSRVGRYLLRRREKYLDRLAREQAGAR